MRQMNFVSCNFGQKSNDHMVSDLTDLLKAVQFKCKTQCCMITYTNCTPLSSITIIYCLVVSFESE